MFEIDSMLRERSPQRPSLSSTEPTSSCLYNDVTLVRSSGASGSRVAVCCGFEEVHRAICTIGKDIVIFDVFTHGVWVDV